MRSGHWSKEDIQKEADKYKTRNDFNKGSSSIYYATIRRGLLDELFKNHPNKGYNLDGYDGTRCIYSYEFTDYNKAYVGLTNNIIRRDKEHVFDINESMNKFCVENNLPLPEPIILKKVYLQRMQ